MIVILQIISFKFLFWWYAVIVFSSERCFTFLISCKLQLLCTAFLKFGKIWFYIKTKGVWVDSLLVFVWLWTLMPLNENLLFVLDSLIWERLCLGPQHFLSLVSLQMFTYRMLKNEEHFPSKMTDGFLWSLNNFVGFWFMINCQTYFNIHIFIKLLEFLCYFWVLEIEFYGYEFFGKNFVELQ